MAQKQTVAIIGAGFTGLAAGIRLRELGFTVTIFESAGRPGGLATGFRLPKWQWYLEDHYHHIFTSDDSIIQLAQKVGHPFIRRQPVSATYSNGKIYQLDSIKSLLSFTPLSPIDRIRMGVVIAYLRATPYWGHLDTQYAADYLQKTMGSRAWQVMWEPLFNGKFGAHATSVSAAWFWARIKKRSKTLLYPAGGFQALANTVAQAFTHNGGRIIYNTSITTITAHRGTIILSDQRYDTHQFAACLSTLPTPLLAKLTPALPKSYQKRLVSLKGLGAMNLILRLKEPFFATPIYWLNINDPAMPFLCVVEQTHFIDQKFYNGEHILYIGKYLAPTDSMFGLSEKDILKIYLPYLQKISPNFRRSMILGTSLKKAYFAQPLIPLDYQKQRLPFTSPIANLYTATMQQVYPWDRGTNYAVALGEEVARIIANQK